ncbi:gamma-glutamyl-gamma-aminobutyrate hydrolase family protein [Streptomyces sp. NPDC050617]|uniref:gamma-glutamyl-gamma-aminobutyrate hydrolase family protein n=1 Tax=Streptomyces sp. NPDC050617 TaxID=3154628 RepID=UPI00344AF384
MINVGITQRLTGPDRFGERRTALDVRWPAFLAHCGLAAVPLPNDPGMAAALVESVPLAGIVLSGGEDLGRYGGDAPERDATERALLTRCLRTGQPLLGVCRGMQVVADHFGAALHQVNGHVAARHDVHEGQSVRTVTCYHRWAAVELPEPLAVTARRGDVVEGLRARTAPVHGIMWHPEREQRPDKADLALFRSVFGGVA